MVSNEYVIYEIAYGIQRIRVTSYNSKLWRGFIKVNGANWSPDDGVSRQARGSFQPIR